MEPNLAHPVKEVELITSHVSDSALLVSFSVGERRRIKVNWLINQFYIENLLPIAGIPYDNGIPQPYEVNSMVFANL